MIGNTTSNTTSNTEELSYNRRQFWPYQRLYGAGRKTKTQSKTQKINIENIKKNNANNMGNASNTLDNQKKITKKIFHVVNNKVATDPDLINRLDTLYIPPAYKDIVVAKSANNKIQAIGTDKRGRRQYIYNEKFTKKRNDRKWDDILELAKKIGPIERDNETAISALVNKPYDKWQLPDDYIPIIIYMLRTYHFRIGNERYVDANNSYGITTLRANHIKWLSNNRFKIEFMGKKGILNSFSDDNPDMANILRKLSRGANQNNGYDGFLFKYNHQMPDNSRVITFITPDQIQTYFQDKYNSYITPKMFRTWYGNYHLLVYLRKLYLEGAIKHRPNRQEKNQIITNCSEHVSSKLNNTPTVSKQSYIDNKILDLVMRNPYYLASKIPDSNEGQHRFLLAIIKKVRNL